MKSIFAYFILYSLLLLNACSKDKKQCSECNFCMEGCSDELPKESMQGYNFSYNQNHIRWYSFNPNNHNQLIVYKEYTGSLPQLIKYDLANNTKEILLEQQLFYSPHWGKKGYILFTTTDAKIWRMNEDGSNLIQITQQGNFYATVWNNDGSKFIAQNIVTENNVSTMNLVLFSVSGIQLDTIKGIGIVDGSNWNNTSLILGYGNTAIGYFDILKKTATSIPVTTYNYSMLGATWSSDFNNVIFTTGRQVRKVDILSKKEECILYPCKNDFLSFPQIQPNTNRVFFVKNHWKALGGINIEITSSIYSINQDGSDGKRLTLPE